MLIPVVAAVAVAFPFLVVVLTLRAQSAIRLCALVSLVVILAVPLNRLDGNAQNLFIYVPGMLAVLTLIEVIRAGRFKIAALPLLAAYIIFGGVVTLYSATASSGTLTWGLSAFILVTGVMQGAVLRASNSVEWFARVFIWIGCALSVYAVFEVFTRAEPIWRGAVIFSDGQSVPLNHSLLLGFTRAQATFGHPLPLALILLLALTMIFVFPARKTLGQISFAVLLGAGILASGSRNAITLAVLLLLYVGVRRLKHMRIPGYLALGAAGIYSLFAFLDSDITGTGSFTHRIEAIQSAANLVTLRPLGEAMFGTGAGSVPDLYTRGLLQNDGLQAVDNQYILLLATDGLLGLALIVAIGIVAARLADPRWRILIAMLAVQGMIFDFLAWPTTGFVAWLILGVALARPSSVNQASESEAGPSLLRLPLPTQHGASHPMRQSSASL